MTSHETQSQNLLDAFYIENTKMSNKSDSRNMGNRRGKQKGGRRQIKKEVLFGFIRRKVTKLGNRSCKTICSFVICLQLMTHCRLELLKIPEGLFIIHLILVAGILMWLFGKCYHWFSSLLD